MQDSSEALNLNHSNPHLVKRTNWLSGSPANRNYADPIGRPRNEARPGRLNMQGTQ